ncbi:hypothetical protein Gogos_012216 [Gossypium gossypioides]|uniref:Uncharacterized protein n=1 Tax=Gossypium gossypioides TaxID=34282 RepID=A0A7J9BRT9_GOSGO|nr:hypothetical protein [Gossypium gossypioides]MBA0738901.1 hypothetical protein [Gossypium gossypioides]MBA0738902.1 hypothetical protein [Gossypium gossypioides]MBA0738903.1 hypothetical protein [Gossypium gossypioides]
MAQDSWPWGPNPDSRIEGNCLPCKFLQWKVLAVNSDL